jgi:putative transposase
MRKSRFTEAQIIGMIKEQEAGMPTAEVCRRHGLSTATFYKLKSKYGGMEVSEAARLKALEDENAKLKRLLADAMLDNVVLLLRCLGSVTPGEQLVQPSDLVIGNLAQHPGEPGLGVYVVQFGGFDQREGDSHGFSTTRGA